jgi:hypothetical protein
MSTFQITQILKKHEVMLQDSEECAKAGKPEIKILLDDTPPWALYKRLDHLENLDPHQPRDVSVSTEIFSGQGKTSGAHAPCRNAII